MLSPLSRLLLEKWTPLFGDVKRPRCLSYLGISGSNEGGTTTFLAFGEKDKTPLFAVKVHRDPDAEERVLNEETVLKKIHSTGGKLARSVPRPIFHGKVGGNWVAVQSILEGPPMQAALGGNEDASLKKTGLNFKLARSWLLKLHQTLPSPTTPVPGLNSICARFESHFDLSPQEREGARGSLGRLSSQNGFILPIQHGDFCRHNILTSPASGEESIRVIDWTDSRERGFPLHDLFFFLGSYNLQSRKGTGIEALLDAFTASFLNANSYSELVRQTVLEYCNALEINASLIPDLFALFLIQQALFESMKLRKIADYGAFPQFTLYLAGLKECPLGGIDREHVWIYFWRHFIRNRDRFIFG